MISILVKSRLLLIPLAFMLAVVIAQAEYPKPSDDYVNDFAEVLSEPDSEALGKMLDDLERQTGIEMTVVTIDSISDYDTSDTTIEAFARGLFNSWGVGHKKENNGVMILVAVNDRNCRIELGGGYPKQYDGAMKEVIETNMLPYFKSDDYSRGIFEGARGAIEKVTKKVSWFSFYKWHLLIGLLIVVCVFAGISCMKNGKKGWGWALFAAAGILFIFLLKMLLSGKRSSGFGGGSSFGGGASGSW